MNITPIKQIIDRHFINSDIEYYDGVESPILCKIDDFHHAINFWKIILYEGYGMRPGMIISPFDTAIRFTYTSLFFAAAELGLVILTPPGKADDASGRAPLLDVMLGKNKIDLVILDNAAADINLLAMANYYGKKTISINEFNNYKIKDQDLYTTLSKINYANPEDKIVITTSSGTTGAFKLIAYTHQQLYKISVRNAKIFDLYNQTVCHTRSMHHAFVLMNGFLPMLHATKYHHTFVVNTNSNQSIQQFIEFIIQSKVSKLVVPTKLILDATLDFMIKNSIKFDRRLDFIVAGFYVTPDYIEKMYKTNARIITNFGSNETFGPLFSKIVDKNTDIDTYVSNNIGTTPDDFFIIELHDDTVHIKCPELYSDRLILSDKIIGDNHNGYLHLGRNLFYHINDIDFTVDKLTEIVVKYCTGKFDVVPDMHYQKLYLVVWDGDVNFDEINQSMSDKYKELTFSNVARLNISEYNQEFKIDFESIRVKFRNREIG